MKKLLFIILSAIFLMNYSVICAQEDEAALKGYYEQGIKYYEEGNYDEAIVNFNKALGFPENYKFPRESAEPHRRRGHRDYIGRKYGTKFNYYAFIMLARCYCDKAQQYRDISTNQWKENQKDGGIELLVQGYRASQHAYIVTCYYSYGFFDYEVFNLFARYCYLLNSYRKAMKYCEVSLKWKENPEAYYLLGEIYFQQNKQVQAKENWKKAVQLNPNDEWAQLAQEKLKEYSN